VILSDKNELFLHCFKSAFKKFFQLSWFFKDKKIVY